MKSQQSKTKSPGLPISTIASQKVLNPNESFDPFMSQRIDGLKIIRVVETTITPNGHIIAFYKGQKVLIPVRI